MGKGPQETTVTQTNIPKYARPFYEELMTNASSEMKRGYEPYTGQRLTDWNPMRDEASGMVSGVGVNSAYDNANAALGNAQQTAQYNPNAFSQYGYGPLQDYRQEVGSFMSPYMQNVVDVQKDRAILDFNRAQAGRDAQAVNAGAFGGSRGAVVDALAQEQLSRQLGGIQATGQQQAFDAASQAFNAQRQAGMSLDQMQAAELGRVQSGQANYGLASAGMQGQLAGQMANVARNRFGELTGLAGLKDRFGKDRMGYQQAGLDIGYQDFLRQRDYGKEQMNFYSGILRGVPVSPSQTTSSYIKTNPIQELLGLGATAAGIYGALR